MAAWMSCCSLSWARNYKNMGHTLIPCTHDSPKNFSSESTAEKHTESFASHLDHPLSKPIKLPLLLVNTEIGTVRFANRGSTYNALDSLDNIHNPFN